MRRTASAVQAVRHAALADGGGQVGAVPLYKNMRLRQVLVTDKTLHNASCKCDRSHGRSHDRQVT